MTDADREAAVAWAIKVNKASGTSYTEASRNAAAFILEAADLIEAEAATAIEKGAHHD